jgi:hypothetical protein
LWAELFGGSQAEHGQIASFHTFSKLDFLSGTQQRNAPYFLEVVLDRVKRWFWSKRLFKRVGCQIIGLCDYFDHWLIVFITPLVQLPSLLSMEHTIHNTSKKT